MDQIMNSHWQSGYVEQINGMDQYYEIYGQGEPLLLLHGFTGSSVDWTNLNQEWLKEFQLIIPDMRGHGRSTNPTATFTHRQVACDMFALLDYLNIEKIKAMGMSGGGNCLLHMATMQPNRMEAMVLISATSYFPEQARSVMRQFSVDKLEEDEWEAMRQRHKGGDTQIRQLYEQGRAFAISYDDMNFTPPLLSTISARTLLVQGDRDFLYPIDIAVEMYKAIPQCGLYILPHAGHVPVFSEASDYFVKLAATFLRG